MVKGKVKTSISIEPETAKYISDIKIVYGCRDRSDVIDKVVEKFYKGHKDEIEDGKEVMESIRRKNPFK